MSVLEIEAPAKVNLVLRVLGRREDGYHEIDSLFFPIDPADLSDRVCVRVEKDEPGSEVCPDPSLCTCTCTCPGFPELDGPKNLAARSACAFLAASGLRARVDIVVEKRIFIAAGLGGGSSDAASVLLALSRLLAPLPNERLVSVARSLGADVPFFLRPAPARVRGIGDRLEPLRDAPALDLLLCNPRVPLSTAEVYAALGLARGQEHLARPRVALSLPTPPLTALTLAPLVENDLEKGALCRMPDLALLKRALVETGALASGMSGSGPTFFGLYRSREDAVVAARALARSHPSLALLPVRTSPSFDSAPPSHPTDSGACT